ncbi:hypothetical protein ACFL5K_05425, partial [Gemmatimonadota bacterium]
SLIEKLEKLENRLNQVERTQKRDISKVEDQLSKVEPGPELAGVDSSISVLGSRMDRISEDLEVIRTSTEQPEETEKVELLAMDLRNLVGELRSTIENSPREKPGISLELDPDSKLSPIEITGFGDFSYAARQEAEEGDNLALGQAEIDLETIYDDKIVMTAAIAYDPGAETFGLGQFTVDFQLFGSEGDHFQSVKGIDHAGFIVGQFDVPFGLDYQVYPSIDRKMVTGPLAVANTHDFWNDYGFQAYAENRWFNAVAYGTNGFGYDEVEMNISTGGRLGIKPHELVEIGTSYAGFYNGDRQLDMALVGFDLQFNYQSFSFKGEYIEHKMSIAGGEPVTNTGFYGQGLYDFGRVFLFGRYGTFSPWEAEAEDNTRISGGGGFVVMEGVEFRLEHQSNSGYEDATLLQVVVGF